MLISLSWVDLGFECILQLCSLMRKMRLSRRCHVSEDAGVGQFDRVLGGQDWSVRR
jgi:hypothetical protein